MLQEIPGQFRLVASLFAKTSTAVNPFIYFFMSEGFRKDTSFVFRRFQIYLFSWFEIISSSSRFIDFFGRKKVLKTKVQLIHLQKRLMTDDVELTTTGLKLDLVTKCTEEESSVFIVIGKRRRTKSLYLNKGRYGDGGKMEHRRRHSSHREKSFSGGDCSCTDTSKDSANITKQTYKKLNICDSCDKIKPQRQIRL